MMLTMEEAADTGCIERLLDGARGIYIPRDFCSGFEGWTGYDSEDWALYQDGDLFVVHSNIEWE